METFCFAFCFVVVLVSIVNCDYPLTAGTKLFRFNIVNIMIADVLAPCVARISAPMTLTKLNKYIIVLHEERFQ